MDNKNISYLSKTFDDYKEELKKLTRLYYPTISDDFDDASVGSWFIDLMAAIGDNLSYHLDRVYAESNINTANMKSSVYNLARNNGFKIPGPKASVAEVKFTCEVPVGANVNGPDENYMPIIKKGTRVSSGNQTFEVINDVNFAEEFNSDGVVNRRIMPKTNAAGSATIYEIEKTEIVVAGMMQEYTIRLNNVEPFMEIILPYKNVLSVESILVRSGLNHDYSPTYNEYNMEKEYVQKTGTVNSETWRFFEVDSLSDQHRWGDVIDDDGEPMVDEFIHYVGNEKVVTQYVTRGEWKPITQKFITEYTDNGYLKIIFGSGEEVGTNSSLYQGMTNYGQWVTSHMVRNNFLGQLPKQNTTMFILFRVGGGYDSNVPAGAIRTISYAKIDGICGNNIDAKVANIVKNSITVVNTTPSVSGKDMPTTDELKYMIKYSNGANKRCVTVKDYEVMVQNMPPKYGCPYRVSATEENNKIILYVLGIDKDGKLTDIIPDQLGKNMQNFISLYRSINDYVEIKIGRIINIGIDYEIFVDKNYEISDVVRNANETIKNYLDISKRKMGDEIFVGDLERAILSVDGVLNIINLYVYNLIGANYSNNQTTQETYELTDDNGYPISEADRLLINLDDSDYILNSEKDEMFEVKFPESDIRCKVKTR